MSRQAMALADAAEFPALVRFFVFPELPVEPATTAYIGAQHMLHDAIQIATASS